MEDIETLFLLPPLSSPTWAVKNAVTQAIKSRAPRLKLKQIDGLNLYGAVVIQIFSLIKCSLINSEKLDS